MENELEHFCGNCQASHPAEPFQSDFAICLNDPELEPYLDDILERQDFSGCQGLIKRKRFGWDREACDDFDPVEDVGEEWSPELTAKVMKLAEDGNLTAEALEQAILVEAFERTDWSSAPIDRNVRNLQEAKTLGDRKEALRSFGFLISQGNKAAFDALCEYLRALPPARTVEDKALRIEILGQLKFTRDYQRELALLLVEDLLRTASNNTTRGWYSEVFYFFERSYP
ncbi:MAG: hypothetical protein KAJ42_10035, partial [Gemmatimonadetes bacterium]|nr:hypothetical protein [Gemmatimonadota bacterium]